MSLRAWVLFACIAVGAVACSRHSDLRGNWAASSDGKTYLVVDDDNGGGCGPMFVDGHTWGYPIGKPAEISSGVHTIHCGPPPKSPASSQGIEFNIPNGVVYHFNYWGP